MMEIWRKWGPGATPLAKGKGAEAGWAHKRPLASSPEVFCWNTTGSRRGAVGAVVFGKVIHQSLVHRDIIRSSAHHSADRARNVIRPTLIMPRANSHRFICSINSRQ